MNIIGMMPKSRFAKSHSAVQYTAPVRAKLAYWMLRISARPTELPRPPISMPTHSRGPSNRPAAFTRPQLGPAPEATTRSEARRTTRDAGQTADRPHQDPTWTARGVVAQCATPRYVPPTPIQIPIATMRVGVARATGDARAVATARRPTHVICCDDLSRPRRPQGFRHDRGVAE